jgi:hypothetical protein
MDCSAPTCQRGVRPAQSVKSNFKLVRRPLTPWLGCAVGGAEPRCVGVRRRLRPPRLERTRRNTLIAHAKDSVWSIDLFRVESILLRSNWVMLVMDVFIRRITGFGIAPHALIMGIA